MSAGLKVFKENGGLLFDTEKITYGLLKSGYLQLLTTWPRLELRSEGLDPADPGSWRESSFADNIFGFSVTDAVAPIVFISGSGSSCGSSRSGSTTTFYFIGATTSTKYYYFDTMRDTLSGAGLKCYNESGVLTFNSLQYPLDIAAVVTAPARPAAIPGLPGMYANPYVGGTAVNGSISSGAPYNTVSSVVVPIGAGEYAAALTFSRSAGMGDRRNQNYSIYATAIQEGAGGVSGGVRFMFCIAARSTQLISNTGSGSFYDIPTTYPTALAIRTENLPFPFN